MVSLFAENSSSVDEDMKKIYFGVRYGDPNK